MPYFKSLGKVIRKFFQVDPLLCPPCGGEMQNTQQKLLVINEDSGAESRGDIYLELISLSCSVDLFRFSSH